MLRIMGMHAKGQPEAHVLKSTMTQGAPTASP